MQNQTPVRHVEPVSVCSKSYSETRSESMDEPEVGSFLTYFINLHERGDFYADVRNAYDRTVFEISGFDIFEDGFMKDQDDLDGLKEYLVSLGIMTATQSLIAG
ncbi:hypothetical protein L4Z68_002395 [Pseudomonas aeruginosa]|uniref:hypothetical protein n=1 Tax=Pseudomonadaceae TaxID=135621 RepID=UPI0010485CCE|nr:MULTISPECIES: hypothetical protein [Pseudomonas aeruginosa group]EKU6308801.1 hypothetical protein [Pseudomonas aeruginosa]EKX2970379.1 hypothetical protein [Pseudomonas aeruginosa]MCO3748173.1 hypothetical protein [Pseudomonas aeruginosa]BDC78576.1 hypothetical protein MRCP2_p3110 [Pseudomonas alcaligenes]HBO6962614.1 hypothetical protein [Pseudomonas aeruginosa]